MTAPIYDELAALVVALQARIAEQGVEIAELRRQLAASSRNSSKSPSADGLDKLAPKSVRGRSGRKLGGQPGLRAVPCGRSRSPMRLWSTSPAPAPVAAPSCPPVGGPPL